MNAITKRTAIITLGNVICSAILEKIKLKPNIVLPMITAPIAFAWELM